LEEDITTDLTKLQNQIENILQRVHENSLALKRFQVFEMKLLKLDSLSEMIDLLLNDAKIFFDLDIVSLCLIDSGGEIAGLLDEADYNFQNNKKFILLKDNELLRSTFGLSLQPFLGVYKQASCAEFFPAIERKPLSVAIIPLSRRGKYLGSLNLGSYTSKRFLKNMATDFIEHMVSIISVCLENNLNFEIMRRTSLVDNLTGVNNRRFLEQRIGEELDRSHRNIEPLSCLFLDIDHFKATNDTYGHQAGDHVLTLIAGIIKEQLRSNDVLVRYGGEEFVALLSNINESKAFDIAERIRTSIKELSISYDERHINISISIGLSCYQPRNTSTTSSTEIGMRLIQSADTALYFAKNNGRDQVAIGESVLDEEVKSLIAS
jgi:diguanylate cyclase (GGDEF)-like protein